MGLATPAGSVPHELQSRTLPSGTSWGSLWRRLTLCVAAGVATTLSFAPFGLYPLSWLTLAVLFVAFERSTLRGAMTCALAFGTGLFASGAYWLLPSLFRHGGFSPTTTFIAAGGVILLEVVHLPLVALARAAGDEGNRALRLTVAMPSAWVLTEYLRTNITINGFPFLSLGYGQIDGPLAGFAPIIGAHGVSLATAVIAGLLSLAWLERRWMIAALAIAVVAGIGFATSRIGWTEETGRALNVVAIQGNIKSDIKWKPEQLQPSLDIYRQATTAALEARRIDLLLWPETAIAARRDQVEPFLEGLRSFLRPTDTSALVGLIDAERTANGAAYYNTALLVAAEDGAYRKRQLVPLTEYFPWPITEDYRREKQNEGIGIFSPGDERQKPILVRGVPLGVSICFETAFGRLVRDNTGGVQLLVSMTNDDWFMGTIMPSQHFEMARMRALESGRELLRVANSGVTAHVLADGAVAQVLPLQKRQQLAVAARARKGLTPYWSMGDPPLLILCACGIVAVFIGAFLRSVPGAGRDARQPEDQSGV